MPLHVRGYLDCADQRSTVGPQQVVRAWGLTKGAPMMRNDSDYLLDSLLADWHHYCQRTVDRKGYPGKAPCFGQSKSNSQYDWQNGLESELVDKRIMQGFDAAAQRVPQPWLTALQFEARNLAVRYQVWASPRLPTDRQAREVLILEARVRLLKELAKDGVLC